MDNSNTNSSLWFSILNISDDFRVFRQYFCFIRHLTSELKKDDIVLIQWFENSIYFMLNTETDSMELRTRNEQDGIFHVTGKVTVSKDMQMEALLEKLEPLLAEYPENLKVLLWPLVRYL
jgi:hypothetical protein